MIFFFLIAHKDYENDQHLARFLPSDFLDDKNNYLDDEGSTIVGSRIIDCLFHPLVRLISTTAMVQLGEVVLALEAPLLQVDLVALSARGVTSVKVPRVVNHWLRSWLRDGGGGEVLRVGGERLRIRGGRDGGGQVGRVGGGWGKVKAGSRKQRNRVVHHQDPPTAPTTTTNTAATSLKNILRKMRKMHFWLITTTFAFKNL